MAIEAPIGHIPDLSKWRRYEPHRMDILRGDFNEHFISPLSHVIVNNTCKAIRANFLESAGHLDVGPIANHSYFSSLYVLNTLSLNLRTEGIQYIRDQRREGQQISQLLSLTYRQQAAAIRFGTESIINDSLDVALFSEMHTVARTIIQIIAKNNPELELTDKSKLIAFLRDPHTPSVLRGFAGGGNASQDALANKNGHPAGDPWRKDEPTPVLEVSERTKLLQVKAVVRDAEHKSHEINERFLDHPLSPAEQEIARSYGLTGSGKRFSSDCPALHTRFATDVPSLATNGLALTPDQVAILIAQTDPFMIEKIENTNAYRIRQDSYATVCKILAEALELAPYN